MFGTTPPGSAVKTDPPIRDVPQGSEPKRSLREGDVVTIQDKDGNYMTAWEDAMRVTWKEEIKGSNNPQFWTLVEKGSKTSIEGYWFHLKSIYGTFLFGEINSDSKKFELFHKLGLSTTHHGSFTCSPWRLNDSSPWQPPNSFRFFCDGDGYAICMVWRIQLVNTDQVLQPPIGTQHEYSQKLGRYVAINFINQSTGGGDGSGLPSLYNTGQNVNNGSGTQKTGDVNIQHVVGSYENVNIHLN